jgi:hypothetical protein
VESSRNETATGRRSIALASVERTALASVPVDARRRSGRSIRDRFRYKSIIVTESSFRDVQPRSSRPTGERAGGPGSGDSGRRRATRQLGSHARSVGGRPVCVEPARSLACVGYPRLLVPHFVRLEETAYPVPRRPLAGRERGLSRQTTHTPVSSRRTPAPATDHRSAERTTAAGRRCGRPEEERVPSSSGERQQAEERRRRGSGGDGTLAGRSGSSTTGERRSTRGRGGVRDEVDPFVGSEAPIGDRVIDRRHRRVEAPPATHSSRSSGAACSVNLRAGRDSSPLRPSVLIAWTGVTAQ